MFMFHRARTENTFFSDRVSAPLGTFLVCLCFVGRGVESICLLISRHLYFVQEILPEWAHESTAVSPRGDER